MHCVSDLIDEQLKSLCIFLNYGTFGPTVQKNSFISKSFHFSFKKIKKMPNFLIIFLGQHIFQMLKN